MHRKNEGFILLIVLIAMMLVSIIVGGAATSLVSKLAYYKSLENVYNQKATAYWIVYTNKNDVE